MQFSLPGLLLFEMSVQWAARGGGYFLKKRQWEKPRLLIGGQNGTATGGGSGVNLLLQWQGKLATYRQALSLKVLSSALFFPCFCPPLHFVQSHMCESARSKVRTVADEGSIMSFQLDLGNTFFSSCHFPGCCVRPAAAARLLDPLCAERQH